jgi:DNA-binding transcriptional MerR regulator
MRRSDGYSIGTVADLVGLEPHTLRAWERRYGAVRPARSAGGTRRYGDAQLARLRLLKALADCGEPIRLTAGLSDDELRRRVEALAGLGPAAGARAGDEATARVALLHPALAEQFRANPSALGALELGAAAAELPALLAALRARPCDVLVLDLERLGSEPDRALEALAAASGARLVVVVYEFARRAALARLARRGARLVRGPLRAEALRRAIEDLRVIDAARRRTAAAPRPVAKPRDDDEPPLPRFSEAQLARLAELASSVDCECPNHLASLVASLRAFERYAQACESRDAADAALHGRLARGTGRARAEVEALLAELCAHDGIVP